MSAGDTAHAVYTIGHSTRTLEEFVALLAAHEVRALVDVRRYPVSRRHPHFDGDALAQSLRDAGIDYVHEVDLGGRRTARADSPNGAWREAGFRGYADYIASAEFAAALARVIALTQRMRTAVMCAEAVPWRCHRRLIADALVARGLVVRHILSATRADEHELSEHARVREGGVLVYPVEGASQTSLF